jgi:CubicO group peptidase (beta-lactamase class C family)
MKGVTWLCALVFVLPALAQAPRPKAQPQPGPGLSSERLARIVPVMDQLVREGKFPGMSVTVAKDGKVAFQHESDFADVEKKEPLRKDAIYRVFSMTKPVTGVAVMILLEEGRFLLDDPVSRYLPCFKDLQVFDSETGSGMKLVKADREVTIRDLPRQTSGFSYGGPADSIGRMYQAKDLFDPNTSLE